MRVEKKDWGGGNEGGFRIKEGMKEGRKEGWKEGWKEGEGRKDKST